MAYVRSDVLFQVGAGGEPLHAILALKRFFTRVDSHVPNFIRDLKFKSMVSFGWLRIIWRIKGV